MCIQDHFVNDYIRMALQLAIMGLESN